jgi:predicted nucleotidyltransferase
MSSILLTPKGALHMDLSEPTRSLSPTLHLVVLAALARTERPLSGRAVARVLAGKASQRGVSDALNHLVLHGLVLREDHPPSASFRLNRDHVASGIADLLGDLREAVRRRCAAEIDSWDDQPEWAALFGSFVRGEGGPRSDIDLALVVDDALEMHRERWEAHIERLANRIQAWTGNRASIITFRRSEFLKPGEPLIDEITREGVTVAGRQPTRTEP